MHGIGRPIAFQLAVVERLGRVMAVRRSHRSIFSLKSWVFTPATKADRFGRAGEAQADALIIDLEDAVAFTDKQKARAAALQYLEQPPGGRLPCALRINAPRRAAGMRVLSAPEEPRQ
jgi:(S)-citramalyl-CoA lyase